MTCFALRLRPFASLPFLPALVLLAGCATVEAGGDRMAAPVEVGIVAINDFHGALEPPGQSVIAPDGKGGSVQVPAGGAAWLASAIDAVRGKYANHLTVSAGDMISASQLSSSLYLDEPTIGVANRIGIDFNAVGNHEFDRGRQELLRMQNGGCEKFTTREPCAVEPQFPGAKFSYLAASTHTENGATLFPATALRRFGKGARQVTVGVIGLTLKDTPELVSPDGVRGLTFADEADTINAAVPDLKAQGAEAVVVLLHQGGNQKPQDKAAFDPNGCVGFEGAIRAILDRLKPGVDVVVSGHTHQAYICDYQPADGGAPILLTSAGLYGEMVTDIALEIDPVSGRVVSRKAHNVIVQSEPYESVTGHRDLTDAYPRFAPRTDIARYVKLYTDASASYAKRVIGRLAGPIARGVGGDTKLGGTLGNLIADAQLSATRGADAQIAFMNPFGVRASLVPAADGSVTFAQIYAVQPFANALVTQTLTGAEIKAALEQNFHESLYNELLSPSAGFSYSYDLTRPPGSRITGMTLNGHPIDPAARYRVTTNSFLANGGDGYTELARQRDAVIGVSDIDALEAWLKGDVPRALPGEERVIARPE